jgi:TonB-linked SusC/RagA family outer membrane protein
MKKRSKLLYFPRGSMYKILLKMKLLTFLMFTVLAVSAADSYSQTAKFSLKLKDATVKEVFDHIEDNSEFILLYNEKWVDVNRRVDIDVRNETVEKILNQTFEGTRNVYKIYDRQIVILKDEKAEVPLFKNQKSVLDLDSELQQQLREISGKVTGTDRLPIPGVSVIVKGTTIGTITDSNGEFSLRIPVDAEILQLSFVGFVQQDIPVGNQTTINVTLREDILNLEEVQVIGYGTQQKATVTGSISSVATEELLKYTSPNVATSLAGTMAGMATVQTDATPGADDPAIYIRGVGSLTTGRSQPLILVDGVERPFSQLDPNEIDNITILKDASATAVFGVRGANGVILVTTRRGKPGKAEISVSSQFTLQQPTRILEGASSYDWVRKQVEMNLADGNSASIAPEVVEYFRTGEKPLLYPDVDQVKLLTKSFAPMHQHNINFSGGTERARYFISLGYLDQGGFFKDFSPDIDNSFNYQRYNYRANLDIDVTMSTLLKINLGGYYGVRNHVNSVVANNNIWWHLTDSKSMATAGFLEDGTLVDGNNDIFGIPVVQSMIEDLYFGNIVKYYQNRSNLDIELKQALAFITKGLEFGLKGAYNFTYSTNKRYDAMRERLLPWELGALQGIPKDDPSYDDTVVFDILGTNRRVNYSDSFGEYNRDWYLESRLFYSRNFENHRVTALALYNQLRNYYPSAPRYIPRSYLGFVGRITYDYKTRYMLDINMGYNGSENFASGKTRFGLFPSLSAGWVVSEEPFMQGIKSFIDYFKLRGSYGIVGNDGGISRFMYIPGTWNPSSGTYDFSLSPNLVPTSKEGVAANPIVTWETSTKQNIGFDATIASRLNINFDLFKEDRKDILISRNTVPNLLAFDLPNVNFGQVENRGFEIALEWRGGRRSGFSYSIRPTLSFARNTIVEMDEIEPVYEYQRQTGGPTGRILGYKFDRWYREDDFNEDGTLKEGIPSPPGKVLPGDPLFVDMNDDDILDSFDRVWIGYGRRPEYFGGLNLGFNYKNLMFTANFTGATNVDWNPNNPGLQHPFMTAGTGQLSKYWLDKAWTPETAETATLPRLTTTRSTHNYANSELFVWDASYIRLKNIQMSYTFRNSTILKQVGVKGLTLSANGMNLFTIDRLKYFDPENLGGWTHPIMRTFTLGLRANF